MLRAWMTLTLVAGLGLTAVHGQEVKWKIFTPHDGRFSVSFPGDPKESKENIPDKGGKTIAQWQYTVETPNGAYLVSYQDAPLLSKADAATIKKSFDAVQANLAKSVQGRVTSEKAIKLGGQLGREFVLELPRGEGQFRYRFLLDQGRFYQVQAVGTNEFATSKAVDHFLDSFQLPTK